MSDTPPSIPRIRQDLKKALAIESNAQKRAELGRALAALERAESKPLDSRAAKA